MVYLGIEEEGKPGEVKRSHRADDPKALKGPRTRDNPNTLSAILKVIL